MLGESLFFTALASSQVIALTKKSEYALLALCELADAGDELISARALSERLNVPLPVLTGVLKQLARAGFVRSTRGVAGGYALARDASDLTLAIVINELEGPLRLVDCVPVAGERIDCDRADCCRLRHPLTSIHNAMMRFLSDYTIADLTEEPVTIPIPIGLMDRKAPKR